MDGAETKKINEAMIETTMALTLLVGWMKGKGLWEEAVKELKLSELKII